jgi:hypothetical protein
LGSRRDLGEVAHPVDRARHASVPGARALASDYADDTSVEADPRQDHLRRGRQLDRRTFAVDVLACASGQGRMKLLALVKGPASAAPPPRRVGGGNRGAAALAGARSAH